MKKQRKKEQKRWRRRGQPAEVRASMPLPFDELEAIFDMLYAELPRCGCDCTRRLTRRWLDDRRHNAELVFAWLDQYGGYCDCEVLLNVALRIDYVLHES